MSVQQTETIYERIRRKARDAEAARIEAWRTGVAA
jgi:hypothetical protein